MYLYSKVLHDKRQRKDKENTHNMKIINKMQIEIEIDKKNTTQSKV